MRLGYISLALLLACGSTDTDTGPVLDTDTGVVDTRPACDDPITTSFSGITAPQPGVSWQQDGLDLTVEAIDGSVLVDTEVFNCLWMHPARLRIDTSGLDCRVTRLQAIDSSGFCGPDCVEVVLEGSDGAEVGRSSTDGAFDVEGRGAFDVATVVAPDAIVCGLALGPPR